MIRTEKSFFHLATMFTNEERKMFFFYLFTAISTPWPREKDFFSFSYYDHYAMIKRVKSFFHLAPKMATPWPREKKFFSFSHYLHQWRKKNVFFNLFTMISTPSQREKVSFSLSYYNHYAMIKNEKSFFHLATMFTNEERKIFFFIYSLRSLCHDRVRKKLFSFSHYVH